MKINSFMTKLLSYRNRPINFQSKSLDWFLYDKDLRQKSYVFPWPISAHNVAIHVETSHLT